jgi:hypothetical protein
MYHKVFLHITQVQHASNNRAQTENWIAQINDMFTFSLEKSEYEELFIILLQWTALLSNGFKNRKG